jgi:hypothetical protein
MDSERTASTLPFINGKETLSVSTESKSVPTTMNQLRPRDAKVIQAYDLLVGSFLDKSTVSTSLQAVHREDAGGHSVSGTCELIGFTDRNRALAVAGDRT